MIDTPTYLSFCDEALEAMDGIVRDLGDELANQRPALPGANSPVQILTHCLGVMAWWAGRVNVGRAVERDRPAEFEAVAPVAELSEAVAAARRQFHQDVRAAALEQAPARPDDGGDHGYPTQGTVLLHVYEELAQHRGQLEITRDVLRAAAASRP